jgi:hypothetical protein
MLCRGGSEDVTHPLPDGLLLESGDRRAHDSCVLPELRVFNTGNGGTADLLQHALTRILPEEVHAHLEQAPSEHHQIWVEEVHDPADRSPEELCSLSQHISGSPLTGSCPFDDWAQIASKRTSPAMLFVA